MIPRRRWAYVIPVAVVMYMLAYLDRTNVAVILPYIGDDFPLSAGAKGLASGIFFVGYLVLQIPAAVLAAKWSARKTVLILMVAWAFAAVLCGLVQNETQLYLARLLLGLFEGGVWPAVLILLASWFPQAERARANALWMTCLPISAILMSPLSGFMLDHMSWRWVFVLQGLPPLVWAAVWWFAVADRPARARWISAAEREYLETTLKAEEDAKPAFAKQGCDNRGFAPGRGLRHPDPRKAGYRQALANRQVLLLVGIYFFWITGFYGFSLWLPSVVKTMTGGSATAVGFLSAVPYVLALAGMIACGHWSDRTGNRRLAVTVPLLVAIGGLLLGNLGHWPAAVQLGLLCVVAPGVYMPYGPFWAIPSRVLGIEVVAVAMGLINALGNLGGFAGPYLVGWLTDVTGTAATGFVVLAAFLAVAAGLAFFGLKPVTVEGSAHAPAATRHP
ncbi:major facilitator transporter [Amycolatopsis mediterranei S699]|uniref:Major facilitator transporter n=2 Tax=Amycolatopsis mediterranei TaxID=33910 RepID=A0A0H3D1H4_AMYMU|nr:MFS transporter [Amycolatopsis mediterranei]ADJ44135.1 major facilitator transporter [Amycolatopsis mediterranei U32]AEK40870.1 major facilitator transporter [Amycolatopsis mediterranei S699]AFO75848.1 major facilitator transporter [Amycolatopsis mediterranei S699]AGT82977.1 major facilitator transporter [Amycolatopsis mediterranei RB]KDO06435.1 MFS transporter [Amycolatopsis mediterranei]